MRGPDGRDFGCPECGELDDFHLSGVQWASVRVSGSWRELEIDEDGSICEWSDFCDEDQETDDINDEQVDLLSCGRCGYEFDGLDLVARDDWDWEKIERREVETPSSGLTIARRTASTYANPASLEFEPEKLSRALELLVGKIHKASDMDQALYADKECGFVNYCLGPDFAEKGRIRWDDECDRLWSLGKALVVGGYEFHQYPTQYAGRRPAEPGDLYLRIWQTMRIPCDNLFELDMSEQPEAPTRKILLLQVWGDNPVKPGTRPKLMKNLILAVPFLKAEDRHDWDDAIFIAEFFEGSFEDLEYWQPEEFDKLTWYRCSRDTLRSTLEVVFDITPTGYMPWKPEARDAALVEA